MNRFYAIDPLTLDPYTENGYVPTFPYMYRCEAYWKGNYGYQSLIRQLECPEVGTFNQDKMVYVRRSSIVCVGTWDKLYDGTHPVYEPEPTKPGAPRKRIVRLKRE